MNEETKFHCPECKLKLRCGCKSCIKRHGKQEGMMVSKIDDVDSCPNCGYSLHVDQWLDVEYEQAINSNINKPTNQQAIIYNLNYT